MYNVIMEKECGCFKRSDFPAAQNFENKDDALQEAQSMAQDMSDTFCQKHNFSVVEQGNDFIVTMELN